ncbi:hypothetical protein MHU86_23763 [Fragilaria crotonensis]|nr:hypothetical protein MHU86_23763 [Fragilaria crotonensis]
MSLRASHVMSTVQHLAFRLNQPCCQSRSMVWPKFRALQFDVVAPTYVTMTKVDGEGVGSIVTVTYTDGTVWELRITEISDRNYTIAYEVLSSTPAMATRLPREKWIFAR